MGQEWSWPCTSRKIQNKRLKESKYNFEFLEQIDATEEKDDESNQGVRLNKLEKIEKIAQSYNMEHVKNKPPSPEQKLYGTQQQPSVDSQSGFSFTEDSVAPEDLNVLVLCEDIRDFDEFVNQILANYKGVSTTAFGKELIL